MRMTKTELENYMRELGLEWVDRWLRPDVFSSVTLPKMLNMIAIHCFINKVPESKAIEAIRYQLDQLEKKGQFDFVSEEIELKVRSDWLLDYAVIIPQWAPVVRACMDNNYYFVVPVRNMDGSKHYDSDDRSLAVLEDGIKGPSPRFRYVNNRIESVNYPGSYTPMTDEQFIAYLERVSKQKAWYGHIEWVAKVTKQEEYRAKCDIAAGRPVLAAA